MPNQPATPSATAYLTRALQLLEKPGPKSQPHSWIKNLEAIDSNGIPCKPESEQAQAWCTIGVLKAVTAYDESPDQAYCYCLSILNLANPAYIATGSKQAQPELNDRAESFDVVKRYFLKAILWSIRQEAK